MVRGGVDNDDEDDDAAAAAAAACLLPPAAGGGRGVGARKYVNGQRGSSQASLALHPLSVLVVVLADLRTWISHSTSSRNMLELGGKSRTSFTRVVDQFAARRPVFIPRPGRRRMLHVQVRRLHVFTHTFCCRQSETSPLPGTCIRGIFSASAGAHLDTAPTKHKLSIKTPRHYENSCSSRARGSTTVCRTIAHNNDWGRRHSRRSLLAALLHWRRPYLILKIMS